MSKSPIVGVIMIACPVCLEGVPVNLRIQSLSLGDGTYLRVWFKEEYANHVCPGRKLL